MPEERAIPEERARPERGRARPGTSARPAGRSVPARAWWQVTPVYQIYPRSFADGNGDGRGDLAGITSRAGYLRSLGIEAVWLSPFYPSPMRDQGYDVSDYCDVDPSFGTLEDFDRLLGAMHAQGIRVIIDLVANHTSDRHAWFQEVRQTRTNPRRDFYIWRDGTPDRPPNNWRAAFGGGPAWTWDEATQQWYLHLFLPEQPDLNWANPAVEQAMHEVIRFWLGRGVDGFRVDVAHGLGKHPDLPDDPAPESGIPHASLNNEPATHAILRRMRALVDSYPGDRLLLGEVYLLDTRVVAEYYGRGDELHLAFNFPPLLAPWEADAWQEQIGTAEAVFAAPAAWPAWVLSNHDHPRARTRYGSEARARAAAVLLLTLRGTPFLYAGEELGLADADVPATRATDPGGRDGARAPIPWRPGPDFGWPQGAPWLPWPPEPETHNAASQAADTSSTWQLYRRLLAARKRSPALTAGSFAWLGAPPGALAYERREDAAGDRRAVAVNFTATALPVPLPGSWRVEVSVNREEEGAPYCGVLPPSGAVVLQPLAAGPEAAGLPTATAQPHRPVTFA
jgi:alpha-glucosidase